MNENKNYTIKIHKRVHSKINEIADYIEKVSNKSHALKYTEDLGKEIYSLSDPLIANAMQPSQWQAAKKYHPQAKRLITKSRKWNIIFRTGRKNVYIYDIIPSTLMK